MLIYSVLARQHRGASALVWVAVAALAGIGLTVVNTLTQLVLTVVAVDTALTLVLLALSLWSLRHEEHPAA
jgi:hypothetical protein